MISLVKRKNTYSVEKDYELLKSKHFAHIRLSDIRIAWVLSQPNR